MSVPETVYQCDGCGDTYQSAEAARVCQLDHDADDRDARRR